MVTHSILLQRNQLSLNLRCHWRKSCFVLSYQIALNPSYSLFVSWSGLWCWCSRGQKIAAFRRFRCSLAQLHDSHQARGWAPKSCSWTCCKSKFPRNILNMALKTMPHFLHSNMIFASQHGLETGDKITLIKSLSCKSGLYTSDFTKTPTSAHNYLFLNRNQHCSLYLCGKFLFSFQCFRGIISAVEVRFRNDVNKLVHFHS